MPRKDERITPDNEAYYVRDDAGKPQLPPGHRPAKREIGVCCEYDHRFGGEVEGGGGSGSTSG